MRKALALVLGCALLVLAGESLAKAQEVFDGQGVVSYAKAGTNPVTHRPIFQFLLKDSAGAYTGIMETTPAMCVQPGYSTNDMMFIVDSSNGGRIKWTINPKPCVDADGRAVRYVCFVRLDDPDLYACSTFKFPGQADLLAMFSGGGKDGQHTAGKIEESALKIAPSAGPGAISETSPDTAAIAVTPELQDEFQKVLVLAILRTDFPSPNLAAFNAKAAETISELGKVLLQTSVRQPLIVNDRHYDLLYSAMTDLFILIRYDGPKVDSIGLVSGPTVAEVLYQKKADANLAATILMQRPAMFKAFARDLPRLTQFERLFGMFLKQEKESFIVQNSLISIQTLIRTGISDPCKDAALAYVQGTPLTYHGKTLPPGSALYTSYGFTTPDGRLLAFADEKTNRNVGFILFAADDLKACVPKHVTTSSFDL